LLTYFIVEVPLKFVDEKAVDNPLDMCGKSVETTGQDPLKHWFSSGSTGLEKISVDI
jgi:hypothetical protein